MPTYSSKQITGLLCAWSDERREATLEELVPLVYDELHRQAHRYLRHERAGHTLQTTALINEAFLKLIEQKNVSWESRTHFFGIASQLLARRFLKTQVKISEKNIDFSRQVLLIFVFALKFAE